METQPPKEEAVAAAPAADEPATASPEAAHAERVDLAPETAPEADASAAAEPTDANAPKDEANAPDPVAVPGPPTEPETLVGTALTRDWKRPPLSECTPEDFMLDFLRFHDRRGDDWEVVWDILDNSLRRSGRPMDCLAFYKELCHRGGFRDRASAKKRVKMPHVFQSLHNYYEHHTYTDIGNNLLNTYERFFLPYENAHPEDRQNVPCAKCKQGHIECTKWDKWGQMVSCDGCDTWYHVDCCEPGSVRRGRLERITSFLCAVCDAAATNVGGIDHSTGPGEPPVKRTRDEIDAVGCARVDEFYERHLAMRRRRNRKHDPDFVKPTRLPAADPAAAAAAETATAPASAHAHAAAAAAAALVAGSADFQAAARVSEDQ